MREIKLVEKVVTSGDYRGISFEIAHPHDNYKFCYYIYLVLDRIEDKELSDSLWVESEIIVEGKERKWIPYHQNDFLSSLQMHGGITFYSKMLTGEDKKAIKIGCDYGHSFDRERYNYGGGYEVTDVIRDLKNTIDDIHDKCTYMLRCSGDGRLVKESDGSHFKYSFYSNDYAEKKGWEIPLGSEKE